MLAVSPWIPRNYNNFQLRPSLHPPTEPGRLSHAMNCCLLTSSSSKAGSVFAISSRVRHAAVSCLPACLHAFLWMQPKQVIEDDEWWQFLVAERGAFYLPAKQHQCAEQFTLREWIHFGKSTSIELGSQKHCTILVTVTRGLSFVCPSSWKGREKIKVHTWITNKITVKHSSSAS